MATAPEPANPAAPPRLTIVDGDDKHAMLLQLALIGTTAANAVMFRLDIMNPTAPDTSAPVKIGVHLTGVESYGPEGTCWSISGRMPRAMTRMHPWLMPYGTRFCATYDVRRRTGTLDANPEFQFPRDFQAANRS